MESACQKHAHFDLDSMFSRPFTSVFDFMGQSLAFSAHSIAQLFEEGARRPVLADEHGRYTDDYTAADEHFALRRTVSRLAEMQGMQYYLSSGTSHTRHPAEGHPGRW